MVQLVTSAFEVVQNAGHSVAKFTSQQLKGITLIESELEYCKPAAAIGGITGTALLHATPLEEDWKRGFCGAYFAWMMVRPWLTQRTNIYLGSGVIATVLLVNSGTGVAFLIYEGLGKTLLAKAVSIAGGTATTLGLSKATSYFFKWLCGHQD